MEKQKIKSVRQMDNPNGVLVETYEGQKGSCWDKGYNEILKDCIGQDVLISIVKNDKGYNTVVELCPLDQKTPQFEKSETKVSRVESGLNFRDEVIISQVILKEANNMACVVASQSGLPSTCEEYGRMLAENINELTAAYKLALSNLQAL